MKKKLTKERLIEQEEIYISILRGRIRSDNYKNAVSKEEYEKQKLKLDKAKLKLKFLKEDYEKGRNNLSK